MPLGCALSPGTPTHTGQRKAHPAGADPCGGPGLPHAVQVGKVEGRQQLTEGSVTDPAEERQGPPEAREEAQLKDTHIVTPAQGSRKRVSLSPAVTHLAGPFSSGSYHPPNPSPSALEAPPNILPTPPPKLLDVDSTCPYTEDSQSRVLTQASPRLETHRCSDRLDMPTHVSHRPKSNMSLTNSCSPPYTAPRCLCHQPTAPEGSSYASDSPGMCP